MSSFRWSGKRVRELLEAMSDDQTNFKTEPSGPLVRDAKKLLVRDANGTLVSRSGYFRIDGAYGGWQLEYVLPYSTGVINITSGHIGSGELADKLITWGRSGLKQKYRELEKVWKPRGKEEFDRKKKSLTEKRRLRQDLRER